MSDPSDNPAPTRQWPRFLIEGVVIVASILLAFGIDAWWDEVQDRREEDEYVVRLVRDLETDVANWHGQNETIHGKQESLDTVLAWVGSPDLGPQAVVRLLKAVVDGARMAYGGVAINSQRSTFDELISTGGLQLLRPSIREALLDYYTQVDFARDRLIARETGYAKKAYELVPRDTEYAVRAGLTESQRLQVAERLLQEDLEATLVAEHNRAGLHQAMLEALLMGASEVLDEIREEGG